jgi:hypothetical protein
MPLPSGTILNRPMSRKKIGILIIAVAAISLIAFGVYHFGDRLFNRYSPPAITVDKTKISSLGGFSDPIIIEKLKIDSLGKEKRPVNYVIEYIATCIIKQQVAEKFVALNEISLTQPGRYTWTGDTADIVIFHSDGQRKRIDSTLRSTDGAAHQEFNICPLKLENDNWYFINFRDPVVIGVYVYIDKTGVVHQYEAFSGNLPK